MGAPPPACQTCKVERPCTQAVVRGSPPAAWVENVTLSEAQMANHTHQMTASPNPGEIPGPGTENTFARSVGATAYAASNNLVAFNPATMPDSGGNQSHDNMQPYLTLNYIIALTGLYPSRS